MKSLKMAIDSVGHTKKAMIEALEQTLGIVTSACRKVGISRQTHYNWMAKDEKYAKDVDELENIAIDFAESQLHKQIKDGNPTSTIFFLKTKGRKRGYVERMDLTTNGDNLPPINIIAPSGPRE